MEKEKEGTAHDPQPPHHRSDMVETVSWTCVAANGTGSLVIIDDVTAGRNNRMNSEVYRALLSTQIQPNAAKLIGWCFTLQMDNDSKHNVKATQKPTRE